MKIAPDTFFYFFWPSFFPVMLIWDKQYGVIPGQVNHFTPEQLRMSTQTHIQNEVKIGADSDNGALFASWQCSFFTKGANSSIKVIWGQHYPLLSNWPAPYNTTTAWSQLKWHFHPLMTNCLLLWRRGGGRFRSVFPRGGLEIIT